MCSLVWFSAVAMHLLMSLSSVTRGSRSFYQLACCFARRTYHCLDRWSSRPLWSWWTWSSDPLGQRKSPHTPAEGQKTLVSLKIRQTYCRKTKQKISFESFTTKTCHLVYFITVQSFIIIIPTVRHFLFPAWIFFFKWPWPSVALISVLLFYHLGELSMSTMLPSRWSL